MGPGEVCPCKSQEAQVRTGTTVGPAQLSLDPGLPLSRLDTAVLLPLHSPGVAGNGTGWTQQVSRVLVLAVDTRISLHSPLLNAGFRAGS
jgi:hypothetical protein